MDNQCALDADGRLKEAHAIDWEYSPTTQKTPSMAVAAPPSPSPIIPNKPIITFGTQLTPASFGNPQKRKADNSSKAARTNPISKSNAGAHQNRQDAPDPKVTKVTKPSKPGAIERIRIQSQGSTSDLDMDDSDDNDNDDGPRKKKSKKGDGAGDIMTVFEPVNPDDMAEGY